MTIGGGPGITSVNVSTSVAGADGVANCVVHTAASSSSGVCSESAVLGRWHAEGTDHSNGYPETDFTLASGGIATNVTDGNGQNQHNRNWSISGNVLTLQFPWEDSDEGITGTNTYVLTLGSNCRAGSGTASMATSDGQTGSMGATGNAVS